MVLARPDSAELDRASTSWPTVLCVDDEPATRRALGRLLRKERYHLRIAESAGEALDWVRKQPFDLIVTDQRMPRMSGLELLREVQKVAPGTPGIILTAYPESVFAEDMPDIPKPALFAKPWDDTTLREGIVDILRGKAPGYGGSRLEPLVAEKRPRTPEVPGMEEEEEEQDHSIGTVLVHLEASTEADLALESMLPLLGADRAHIVLLRVHSSLGLHRNLDAELKHTRESLVARGFNATTEVRWGDAAEQIGRAARNLRADLVVVTQNSGQGLDRLLRKTLAEKILEHCDVPLLACPSGLVARRWKQFLLPLDGSRGSEVVVPVAVKMARRTGASIDVLGVESLNEAMALSSSYVPHDPVLYLTRIAASLELLEIPSEPFARVGDPGREILRQIRESKTDLVFMTHSRKRGFSSFLWGSVAGKVIRSASCPVYICRSGSS